MGKMVPGQENTCRGLGYIKQMAVHWAGCNPLRFEAADYPAWGSTPN